MRSRSGTALAALMAAVLLGATPAAASARTSSSFGPPPPQNPAMAANGLSSMHADSASSGTTPLAGPGTGKVSVRSVGLAAACPTVVVASDGFPLAICTRILDRKPVVHLLDPSSGNSLASLAVPSSGNLFGGVYSYLDDQDRVVLVDGNGDLVRIAHQKNALGLWTLKVVQRTPLGDAASAGVVGLVPDFQGRVWFATAAGVIGTISADGAVATSNLPAGEEIANSISTAPYGTAVSSDHALYLMTAGADGRPAVAWRQAYDRGPARKPGQLSHGTGATPVFFGPSGGLGYITITDNASPRENLLVFRKDGTQVCSVPVLTRSGTESGTEDAPVAIGGSVFVTSTYGYPYPATPAGAEPTSPASANFTGGMTRVDLNAGGTGCSTTWDIAVRLSALPRLSLADGKIYTIARRGFLGTRQSTLLDSWDFTVIDADTGDTSAVSGAGAGEPLDTIQLSGTVAPGGVFYQGTVTGLLRITGGR